MSGYEKGGRGVFFAQQIGRGGKIASTFEVLVERDATLSEDLSEIQERRTKSITVLIHPGFDDVRVVRLDREDAARLRDLLADALTATERSGFVVAS